MRRHYNLFPVVKPSSDVFKLSLFTFGKFTSGKWRENLNLNLELKSILGLLFICFSQKNKNASSEIISPYCGKDSKEQNCSSVVQLFCYTKAYSSTLL